ncbi:MAG: P-type conjugative transfer protein TrbG [Rhizobiaceae bacterium]
MTHKRVATALAIAIPMAVTACAKRTTVPQIAYDDLEFHNASFTPETKAPVSVVELPKPLPLPGQLKKKPGSKGKDKTASKDATDPMDEIASANEAAKIEPSKSGYINAIQNYPYMKGALYQLYAAVNQVSDIALQPGEKLVSVSAGDTVRWVVGDTSSGTVQNGSNAEQVHILIKPISPDLQTNLVIATDRRTYHLEMHSTKDAYMASVSWVYPASQLHALRKDNNAAIRSAKLTIDRGIDLNRLKFRYRIEGNAPWKPVRAFDDGNKVYIQFPSGLKQGEAPPLFVVGYDGRPALVNYRVRANTYIVDRLFAAAELRLGSEPQQIVRIVRKDAKWRTANARRRAKPRTWSFNNDR